MNQKLANAKNFVKRNERRVLLATTVVATTIVVLQNRGIASLNEFLEEKGLTNEYYHNNEE